MRIFLVLLFLLEIQLNNFTIAQSINASQIVKVEGKTYILHQVEKGETIFSLCKHYQVEQKELIAANSQLIFGLKEGDTLKIPYITPESSEYKSGKSISENQALDQKFNYHLVKSGDTVYAISKLYNVSIEAIYRYNPEAKNELLINEIIRIPNVDGPQKVDGLMREDQNFYYHTVQPGDTPYSLSKRYGTTINGIYSLNPSAAERLDLGMIIKIPKEIEVFVTAGELKQSGNFFSHRVEKGDTFYSYKRRFGVSREQLLELNPALNEGLLTGLTIKIPSSQMQHVEVTPADDADFIKHKVAAGETLYSLSKVYNIGVIDIQEFNPELKSRGLILGEIILLPKISMIKKRAADLLNTEGSVLPEVTYEVEKRPTPFFNRNFEHAKGDTFRIALFLPLYFEANQQHNVEMRSQRERAVLDSLKTFDRSVLEEKFKIVFNKKGMPIDTVLIDSMSMKHERSLYQHSRNFVDFYQGFLLALDSLTKAGVNVKLDLFDDEYNAQTVDLILKHHNLINTHLIVGPVDVRLQKHLSAFSYKNQISMVSPFSPSDEEMLKNPFYFQVNPTKQYVLKKTSDFIGDAFYDKNFIIMTLGKNEELSEMNLANLVRDKFFSSGTYKNINEILFTEVDFAEGGNLGYWQVKRTLKPNIENVIFVPTTENRSEREALLSRAINSLYVLSEEFNITLVGLSDYPQFKSINTEYFHRLNLHYLTPNYVDYTSKNTQRFIQLYREHFYSEPNQYSYRGYDIACYFIGAYQQFGRYFYDSVGSYSPQLTQNIFNFQKVEVLSGYMNHTLFIMNFTPDYQVKVISKVSEGKVVF